VRLGNVIALSNANGQIVEGYAYSVFGGVIVNRTAGPDGDWLTPDGQTASQSAYGNPYLFTGREFEPETGLYYYRARYYDPAIGRFLQSDPIGYAGGMNLYAYVSNNPANFTDPLGLYGKGVHQGLVDELTGNAEWNKHSWGWWVNHYDEGWTNPWYPWSGPSHFRSTWAVNIDLRDVLNRGDLGRFLQLLHQYQDSYSHAGYSYWTGGHIWDNLRGHSPDDYDENSARDKNMCKGTNFWIDAWKKRWGSGDGGTGGGGSPTACYWIHIDYEELLRERFGGSAIPPPWPGPVVASHMLSRGPALGYFRDRAADTN